LVADDGKEVCHVRPLFTLGSPVTCVWLAGKGRVVYGQGSSVMHHEQQQRRVLEHGTVVHGINVRHGPHSNYTYTAVFGGRQVALLRHDNVDLQRVPLTVHGQVQGLPNQNSTKLHVLSCDDCIWNVLWVPQGTSRQESIESESDNDTRHWIGAQYGRDMDFSRETWRTSRRQPTWSI
jgi:hypothetical protein